MSNTDAWPHTDRRQVRGFALRPMDFYVAFLVMLMGVYGIIDPNWPPEGDLWMKVLITVEDIYFIFSGLTIMGCLVAKQANRRILLARQFEMLAWLYTCCAAFIVVVTIPWVPPIAIDATDGGLVWVWGALWAGLSVASYLRWSTIRRALLNGVRHE